MRRAVAIDPDSGTRAVVAQLAADEGLSLEVWDPAAPMPAHTADVDLVVLGAVATPTLQIRRCQLALPRSKFSAELPALLRRCFSSSP